MRWTLFALLFALATACGGAQRVAEVSSPSGAKIAVEVIQDTTLAGRFKDDLAARLRQTLLESKAGVPVTAGAESDLVLRVTVLTVNFSNATSWEWQLIEPDSGAIVASQTETAAMGRNAGPLAADIVGAIAALDLAPFAGSTTAVAAAQPAVVPAATDPASSTDGANAWAVVVGVQGYREGLPEVKGGESDALAFAAYAKNTLNVPEPNIKLLLGDRASRADMTGALTEWLPRNARQPGGRVYVFFSGHGAPDVEDGSAYLLPWDANPSYIKSSGFSVSGLQEQLATLKGQEVFVFLDACFSGLGERSALPEGTRPVVAVKDLVPVGSVVTFSAAGATQTTGASADGTRGLFSYHLLDGLRGAADADADGSVTVSELHRYVSAAVAEEARRQNREQTPTLAAPGDAAAKPLVTGLPH